VICNTDFAHAQRTLLDSSAARPSKLDPSCSGYVLLIKARAGHAALAHHNLFFFEPDAYRAEFDEIFAQRLPPSRPTLYVCITNKTDVGHAPSGCENWFVLANMPYLTASFDWEHGELEYRERVLTTLQQQLARHTSSFGPFEVHSAWTPQTIQDTYGGNLGAIYGFSSNSPIAAFMRPANRAKGVRGLYYAGGSVHPGGGVPLVALSGMAAAGCVLGDEKTRRR
jgi:phytoene dehydrogenase-like protein